MTPGEDRKLRTTPAATVAVSASQPLNQAPVAAALADNSSSTVNRLQGRPTMFVVSDKNYKQGLKFPLCMRRSFLVLIFNFDLI